MNSEIRKAYLLNKYVIIAPDRAKRPHDVKEEMTVKRTKTCPFCIENIKSEEVVDEIKKDGENSAWRVLCLKNVFPAVSLDNEKAFGIQEVIVETPEHTKELGELEVEEIEAVLRMYAKRTKAISQNKKIDYILCFKNQGSKAGASIVHDHSQIFATHILPPDIKEESQLAKEYEKEHKTCAYCDIIKKELKSERKIYEDEYVAAIAPFASQYSYEAWIFSKRHLDNIAELTDEEFNALAKAYKIILEKLRLLDLSFNVFLHQVVSDKNQHFHMKIEPRESVWGGVELGSGMIINSVSPEEAAEYFRE
jgi:UDPglucose--hexose-1-phosphate uridylyltransferase